jgi:histidinol-phosphate aminotransferase
VCRKGFRDGDHCCVNGTGRDRRNHRRIDYNESLKSVHLEIRVAAAINAGINLAGLDIGYGLLRRPIAKALGAQGLNNPHLFNRLAIAAAAASLQDSSYVAFVTRRVSEEREKWFELFRELKLNFTPSGGNFVFFETGLPNADFAAALLKEGVAIGRAFPPYDRWARISIGLAAENAVARAAVRKSLRASSR